DTGLRRRVLNRPSGDPARRLDHRRACVGVPSSAQALREVARPSIPHLSGLLPHVVREAVEQKSLVAASASFGLVALILLFVLLVEWDGIESSAESRRVVGLGAVVLP